MRPVDEIKKDIDHRGHLRDEGEDGLAGLMRHPQTCGLLRFIASWGEGWDHISVSLIDRIPTWVEMCFIKRLFFRAEEVVMQLHPAESKYVNVHPNVLHLWRPQELEIPLPPKELV